MLEAKEVSPSTTVLIERGGSYFVYEPALGIIASGDTVEGAYRKFLDTRRDLMEQVERAGLTVSRNQSSTPLPAAGGVPGRSFLGELGLFAAKLCIVLVLVGAIGGMAVRSLAKSIDGVASGVSQALAPFSSIVLADVVRKADDVASDARSLTVEQKESLRRSIGILSRELQPLFEAWRDPPQTQAPADDQKR
jgi:hypothetical protein